MEIENTLKEIPADDIPLLLKDLESDLPNSIHALSFISTLLSWKRINENLEMKILAPNGDIRLKFIVFYNIFPGLPHVNGSIHKWSHNEDDNYLLNEALRRSDQIPWKAEILLLTSMTPETEKVVVPVFNDILGKEGVGWRRGNPGFVYWISKEEVKNWTVEAPEGTYLSFLSPADSKQINAIWPHRYDGSVQLIATMIQVNFGIGLYESKSGNLLAWALHWFYGGIGLLQTEEAHKRKGYARVVLKATAKEIADRGYDVHLKVNNDNLPSLTLIQKLGFLPEHESLWCFKLNKNTNKESNVTRA